MSKKILNKDELVSSSDSELNDDIGILNRSELELLWMIRNVYRYGEISLLVRDGRPHRIIKAFESQDISY